ncbi:hypothetical protein BMF94_6403 [Rhodotorula taiwanensis]|uniref:Uncharacterized protein n=1 Tax=Rhodotorula taiwanensis TaxID=741276 RepID=A0A2S5B1J9_9BASI|nr:hypothetical protein BMF94_6403 [Rhodotorula taiwanensis]
MLRSQSLKQPSRLARRQPASLQSRLSSSVRSTPTPASPRPSTSSRLLLGLSGAGALAAAAYTVSTWRDGFAMDAEPGKKGWETSPGAGMTTTGDGANGKGGLFHFKPHVFLWGRNSHGVTSPSSADSAASPASSSQTVKRPSIASPLSDLVLRDLALSATYGVAVDANGDVLQWGAGFQPSGHVERTVQGRDIVKVAATQEGKVFGLSKKGDVFVWAAEKEMQKVEGGKRAIGGIELPRSQEGAGWMWALGKGTVWGRGSNDRVETVRLGTDVKLDRGERFTSLSAGASHLLALTNHGRSFALPLCLSANSHGQLGVRSVTLLAPPHPGSSPTSGLSLRLEPDEHLNEMGWEKLPPPPKKLDPLLLPAIPPPTPSQPAPHMDHIPALPTTAAATTPGAESTGSELRLHPDPAHHAALERSIHFCTTLHEIPALRGVEVAELAAGRRHSLARLGGRMHGRVLGWGSNSYGQLGLGSTLSYPSIPAPTEVPFRRSAAYQGASRPNTLECVRVAAGGNVSYFVVEADDGKAVDLLASGQGQFGGLGNGLWAHATSPVRVKTVSGLREWNETTGKVESVGIKDVQAGDGHVAVVLDNAVKNPDGTTFGRDVFVWGYNEHYQLGTGKRSNLPTPQHLAPLPYPRLIESQVAAAGSKPVAVTVSKQEETISSGTTSPMPHKRMQLSPAVPSHATKLPRGAVVEEAICAGDGGSGVYWRIINP